MKDFKAILLEAKKINVVGVNGNYLRWTLKNGKMATECPKCGHKETGKDANDKMEKHLKECKK